MNKYSDMIFHEYYMDWVDREKRNAVRDVTLSKYLNTGKWLKEICPELSIKELNRKEYQNILNEYAVTHEKQTVKDFHTQLKACITELFEERIIDRNPSLRPVFKGKTPAPKKNKYLGLSEINSLVETLNLKTLSMDWIILVLAKTGLRYSEVIALTPNDLDFENLTLTVSKTWNYKKNGGFVPTKNESSVRTISIDWQITAQLSSLIKDLPRDEPIFVEKLPNGSYKKVYNSTINGFLERKCKEAGLEPITIHGLRHSHGSILISQGVSILSVSKRLGHSNVTTTQEVYLHITDELHKKDNQLMMGALAGIR